ncbi:MAG: flagellar filament capping protein FliD [Candidatus Sericytochromatia bacterium]|nr:flagellar filament capping protein FliD [Candidatus Sericytochromatia bacterium]
MALQLSGLASGMDTKSVIEQLMALEQQPVLAMQKRQLSLKQQNDAFQAISKRLTDFKTKATALTRDTTTKAMKATTSDAAILGATASTNAAPGSLSVTVKALASATKATSTASIGTALGPAHLAQDVTTLPTASTITTGTFSLSYTVAGATQNASVTISAAGGGTNTLQEVLNAIGTATGGAVTASISNNRLVLSSATATNIQVGSNGDTSNFLRATYMQGASFAAAGPAGGTVTSNQVVGTLSTSKTLATAGLATALAPASGSFAINGKTIAWDSAVDSLADVLSRINSAGADVVASYSQVDDKVLLSSRTTGSAAIAFSDTSGNMLAALGLDVAQQARGTDARIAVAGFNGGADILSASNDFSSVVPGVTLTARKVDATAQTVTIDREPGSLVDAAKAFVDSYNSIVDAIDNATAKGAPNAGDPRLAALKQKMTMLMTGRIGNYADGYDSLGSLGISASKEDRKHLRVDEAKLNAALVTNRDRVAELFQRVDTSPTVTPVGVARKIVSYIDKAQGTSGVFKTQQQTVDKQTQSLDKSIKRRNEQIERKRTQLQRQFTRMEQAMAKMQSQQNAFVSQMNQITQR